jgi:hypothetical protein
VAVRVRIAAAVAVIALGTIPRTAGAEGAGVIAVSTRDRGAVAAAMVRAMAAKPGRIVEDAVGDARAAIAAGTVPVESLQRFRRVREQIDEGWRAYLRVAVELSASRLATARTDAEALVALPGGAELYADAALRLGAVLGHLGRKTESQSVLALAVAMDPDRPITLAEFSPDVVGAVDAARAAPVALQRIRITTEPAGALVRIDGKDIGRAPLDAQVTRGQHVIVARSPLHQPAVQGINVGEPVSLQLTLERDDAVARIAAAAEPGLGEAASQQLIDATLRYADLDEVVLVSQANRRGGPTLLVQRCAGVPARCSAVVEIGYGDQAGLASAALSAWQAAATAELRYPPSVLGERDGKVDDGRCHACRSPWLWTGVGAALVVGTVITLVVTSASKPAPIVVLDPGGFRP